MATTTTATVVGICSLLGISVAFIAPQAPEADAIPWKEVLGTGSFGGLLFAIYLNHKHVEKVTDAFRGTTEALFKETRDDNQASRRELQELVKDLKRNP